MSAPAQTPPSANDLLGGGDRKYRSLSFKADKAPVWHRGLTILTEPETWQDRDDDGNLLFWDKSGPTAVRTIDEIGADGKPTQPIYVFNVKVRLPDGFTPDPDVIDEYGDDDGVRFLYFRGQKRDSKTTFDAIATACRKARTRRGLQPGGTLAIGWVAGGETKRGASKSTVKEYEAEYDPSTEWPAGSSANGQLAAASGGQTAPDKAGTAGPVSAYGDDDEPPF